MSLVTSEELVYILRKEGLGMVAKPVSQKLMHILHLNQLNELYTRFKHLPAKDFIDAVLSDLNITYEVSFENCKETLELPQCIYIANHPLGGIDGLILLRILLDRHENINILTNFLLSRIEPLRPYFCSVNPFETRKDKFSSSSGMRLAIQHLNNKGSLAIFPAGQVSALSVKQGIKIQDKDWEMPAIKLIKKASLPVFPVYFHAKNSATFYALSTLHGSFRTAALPGEIFKAKGSKVYVKIGNPVAPEEVQGISDIFSLRALLRDKTYTLGADFRANPFKKTEASLKKFSSQLTEKLSKHHLSQHIHKLEENGALVLNSGDYKVFCTKLTLKSPVMQEIGRLREITFQSIGEGTNKKLDIDNYDQYYHHLILWHESTQSIAGAYRLGLGREISNSHGIQGFYLSSLFRMEESVSHMFKNGLELGRAFVAADFQTKPLPLFLMWKGILAFVKQNTDIKYITGAVSISNNFSIESKQAIVAFLKEHHTDKNLLQYVTPLFPFQADAGCSDIRTIQTIAQLDKLISKFENGKYRLPVLIKKYLMLNARFIDFNVDPAFNNAIDGLMYLPVSEMDNSILCR